MGVMGVKLASVTVGNFGHKKNDNISAYLKKFNLEKVKTMNKLFFITVLLALIGNQPKLLANEPKQSILNITPIETTMGCGAYFIRKSDNATIAEIDESSILNIGLFSNGYPEPLQRVFYKGMEEGFS